jgi:hypothetical protein
MKIRLLQLVGVLHEDIPSKIGYEPLMGIAREMTPTVSNRGIVCHPKIAPKAYSWR